MANPYFVLNWPYCTIALLIVHATHLYMHARCFPCSAAMATCMIMLTAHCNVVHLQEKDEAEKFFQRKVDYVTENLEKMQQLMMEKHKMKGSEYD